MSDVSGRFLADFLDSLERRSFDVAALLDSLPIDRPSLRTGHPMIDWDSFVKLMDRVECEADGPTGMENLGSAVSEVAIAPLLRRLAGFAATPYALYAAGERWAIRRAIPLLETRIDPLDGTRFQLACRIPGTYRACPPLMHLATGVLRSATGILDLPRADVTASVDERSGEWTIVPPRSDSIWMRMRRAMRALLSTRSVIDQLEAQQCELEEGLRRVSAAYKELESSEARYRALAEAAVDLSVELTPDLRLQYVSPSAIELLGREPDTMAGGDFTELIHPSDRPLVVDFMRRVFCGGRESLGDLNGDSIHNSHDDQRTAESPDENRHPARPTCRIEHQGGHFVWMEMDARIYRNREGVDCAVAMIRDVTERVESDARDRASRDALEVEVTARTEELRRKHRDLREIQTLLLDAERMGTAKDLAGRIAHSINNPLSALLVQIGLMIDESKHPDPRLLELLALTSRVGDVVERTLSMYRDGKINLKSEDIESVMQDLYQSFVLSAKNVGIRTRLEVAPDVPAVPVDRPLLLAALESIAENSLDFVPPHGEIFLKAEVVNLPGRDVLRISISDTGPGILPAVRRDIFTPFFTTKKSGTGLGLAIARGIINGHQGELRVEERPGGGAQFVAELPLTPAP